MKKIDNITLINDDCLEAMDVLIDDGIKVDAIITDPPYGTTACKWDSVIDFDEMWDRLRKIRTDNTPIVLFGSEPFSSALRISNMKEYKYDWKWQKSNGTNFLSYQYQPARVIEDIIIFGNKATTYSKKGTLTYNPQMEQGKHYKQKSGKQVTSHNNTGVRSPIKQVVTDNKGTRYPKNIQRFNKDKNKLHPTQKPVALLEFLIKTYTNEGDVVLDFTMGSGTTGVACKKLNRSFIGIELDKQYFKIAEKRINENVK